MNEVNNRPNKAVIAIIVIVLLALIAGGSYFVFADKQKNQVSSTTPNHTTSTSSNAADSNSQTAASYKDGTYSATGSYISPGGQEAVKVELTLSHGTITDANVTPQASDSEAREYQNQFISGYKTLILSKPINEVKLDVVAGSSLTSGGFNQAVEQIKRDAAA